MDRHTAGICPEPSQLWERGRRDRGGQRIGRVAQKYWKLV